jgi:hypothetical protein
MKVQIEFATDNAAFTDSYYPQEVRHVLRQVSEALLMQTPGVAMPSLSLYDSNGNVVGRVRIDPDATDICARALSVIEESEGADEHAELIGEMRGLVTEMQRKDGRR